MATTPSQDLTEQESSEYGFDLNNPEDVYSLYQADRDYRKKHFEDQWAECIQYDENYDGSFLDTLVGSNVLRYAIKIPQVAINNDRKATALGQFKVNPKIHTETLAPNYMIEIHETLLRWAFRTSRIESVVQSGRNRLVNIGQSWFHVAWDRYALKGKGAPKIVRKTNNSIVVDSLRREVDPNIDCRWIFEVQDYAYADLETTWPKHFSNVSFKKNSGEGQETETFGNQNKSGELSEVQQGLYRIIRCEYIKVVDGVRRVYAGILDPSAKEWIEDPADNGLGMYSYIAISLNLREDYAYPIPPTQKELPLADATNLFYSLGISQAILAGSPPGFYDQTDENIASFFEDGYITPGKMVPFMGKSPEFMQVPSPDVNLRMAQIIEAKTNESSQIAAVQRGDAPDGVQSGRAINALRQEADAPLDKYREAEKNGITLLATALYELCKDRMKETRFISYSDQGKSYNTFVNKQVTPEQLAQLGDPNEQDKYYTSAELGGETMSVNEAISKAQNPDDLKLFINDIRAGNLEAYVEIIPELTQQEKMNRAAMLANMQLAPEELVLKEFGIENPSEVIKIKLERDKIYQLGKQVAQHPEILEIAQKVLNDPSGFLQQIVNNPSTAALMKDAIANYQPPIKTGSSS